MKYKFDGLEYDAFVSSFDDGTLKYQVNFMFFDKTPETAQSRALIFPIKSGVITLLSSGNKRLDELISILAFRLLEEYPHDIKGVTPSSTVSQ